MKFKEVFLKIWKDPVWSKLIATGITALIILTWAKVTNHSWKEVYLFLFHLLSFNVPVFIFLSIIGIYFISKKCIQIFKAKKDPFWDEQIGNYTFKELYNIFVTETLPVQNRGMQMFGRPAPVDNLLSLFRIYYIPLNSGFGFDDNLDDGNYLYSVFAPRLLGFGLVDEYQKPLNNLPGQTEVAYRTSVLGHKFHANIDKLILADKLKSLKKKKA